MTLRNLMDSEMFFPRVMIVVRNYDMYVVAQGSPKAPTVQKFFDVPLDSFLWDKDGKLIVDLPREVTI